MEIEDFKYRYNAITTLSAKQTDFCRVDFDRGNFPVDISNSLTFYNVVEQFNHYYQDFKKDLEILPNLGFGKLVFSRYEEYDDEFGKFKYLGIIIPNPKNKYDRVLLKLFETSDGIYSVVSYNGYEIDDELTELVKIDRETIKKYLSFASSHRLLLQTYNELKNKCVYGDGTTLLFSKISDEIFDELKTFEFSGGNAFFDSHDGFKFIFKLGEKIELDYSQGKIVIFDKDVFSKELIDDLTGDLYINRTKLPEMFSKENEKVLVKK